jgi:hypothetical protein
MATTSKVVSAFTRIHSVTCLSVLLIYVSLWLCKLSNGFNNCWMFIKPRFQVSARKPNIMVYFMVFLSLFKYTGKMRDEGHVHFFSYPFQFSVHNHPTIWNLITNIVGEAKVNDWIMKRHIRSGLELLVGSQLSWTIRGTHSRIANIQHVPLQFASMSLKSSFIITFSFHLSGWFGGTCYLQFQSKSV